MSFPSHYHTESRLALTFLPLPLEFQDCSTIMAYVGWHETLGLAHSWQALCLLTITASALTPPSYLSDLKGARRAENNYLPGPWLHSTVGSRAELAPQSEPCLQTLPVPSTPSTGRRQLTTGATYLFVPVLSEPDHLVDDAFQGRQEGGVELPLHVHDSAAAPHRRCCSYGPWI